MQMTEIRSANGQIRRGEGQATEAANDPTAAGPDESCDTQFFLNPNPGSAASIH
jgi:hypothetical protein